MKVHSPVHLLKNISCLVSRKCKNILKGSGPRTDVEGIGWAGCRVLIAKAGFQSTSGTL